MAAPTAGASAASADVAHGYRFTPIEFLGDPAPGGGVFTFDFEPSAVNNRGEVAFTADLASTPGSAQDIGEGVFVGQPGQISNLARVGQPAPGGGTFDAGELGRIGLNNGGDASFAFTLSPTDPNGPTGLNGGVYRFSVASRKVTALLVPGQTAPGRGRFKGTYFNTGINNRSDVVFSGIVTGGDIHPGTPPGADGLGTGLFLADSHGDISTVARPGDPAPGGKVFDSAINGSINDAGAIAFGGHVAGEECVSLGSPLVCGESVYLRTVDDKAGLQADRKASRIRSVAHQGDASPCDGKPYRTAFGPVLNSRGDIVFIGDLTPAPSTNQVSGVLMSSDGRTSAVACPGDRMPGGGTMVSAGGQDATYSVNNERQVSFAAAISDGGVKGSGIYLSSDGSKSVVARTGTVIPGVGTVANVGLGYSAPVVGQSGGEINDRGQVLFSATLTNGKTVLLLATPKASERSAG